MEGNEIVIDFNINVPDYLRDDNSRIIDSSFANDSPEPRFSVQDTSTVAGQTIE